MSRLRTLKPGFFLDEVLAECQPLARLLFAGLWTIADREGRLEDRPRRIKVEVLPYDECDVDALLNELAEHGFVLRYEVGGTQYIAIPTWSKHQTPHMKEAPSTIPAPDEHGASTIQAPYEPPRSCLGSCLGSCLQSGTGASTVVDNSPANVAADDLQQQNGNPHRLAVVLDLVAEVVGEAHAGELLTAGTDLNATAQAFASRVDDLVAKQLSELADGEITAAKDRCLVVAFSRIARTHAEKVADDDKGGIRNLPAYLTRAAKTAVLGDLVGDDLVRELRSVRRGRTKRHGGEPSKHDWMAAAETLKEGVS